MHGGPGHRAALKAIRVNLEAEVVADLAWFLDKIKSSDWRGAKAVTRQRATPIATATWDTTTVRLKSDASGPYGHGWFQMPGFTYPHIAGMDVAGTVSAVGDAVTGVSIGDRVVVDPAVCRSVADYAKDVTIVECTASGHAPFIDEGELYHSELHSFIAKQL